VVDGDGNIAILDKGIDAVDNFYLARMHMYKTVYYHKTLVGYELILRRIYENLCEYYPEEVRIFKSLQDIVKAIRSEDIIYWNDDWLIGLMINVLRQRRTPKELKELIEAFFKRKGYKVLLDISNFSNQPLNVEIDKDVEIIQTIETIVKNIVEDHQVTIFVDDIKILDEDPHVVPRVVFGGKKSLPITDCTACIVKYIPRRYHVKRLYVLSGKWDRVLEELKYRGLIP
ncbi:MAG: hypothetical protein QW775_07910, partial [Ignisphaera sp.]